MYQTKDTNLAAYLISRGIPLTGNVERNHVTYWELDDRVTVDGITFAGLLMEWDNGFVNCNARQLFLARNMLLDIVKQR